MLWIGEGLGSDLAILRRLSLLANAVHEHHFGTHELGTCHALRRTPSFRRALLGVLGPNAFGADVQPVRLRAAACLSEQRGVVL